MICRSSQDKLATLNADTLILFQTDNAQLASSLTQLESALQTFIANFVASGEFSGKNGDTAVLYPASDASLKRIIIAGLGNPEKISSEMLRRASATAIQKARSQKVIRVATILPDLSETAFHFAEGVFMGLYQYHGQKSTPAPEDSLQEIIVLSADNLDSALKMGASYAQGTNLTRDLINLPANICTPQYLASTAQTVGKQTGLKVTILETRQLQALKMGALLAVAQGSETPPCFIIMEHKPAKPTKTGTIVLVGKGVTFDTGGYSIKTTDGMVGMKADMSGGAAIIGAMQIIAELAVPMHVVGLIPAADNMISGDAYRPQDVVTASNGKTIEIISTDAEGRLLLADALVYAKRYDPVAVVDIATLTGAMIIALGNAASGFYANDDHLSQKLTSAGDATFERLWRLPIYEEYGKPIESDTADMKNSGGAAGRAGGAGVAAHFLSQFIDYNWAHIDMAGMLDNKGDQAYAPKNSAKGYGARLLAEFVRNW